MSTEAQDKAVLNELVAIRLYGLELHIMEELEPAEAAQPEPESTEGLLLPRNHASRLATVGEAEDAWRKLEEGERERWRAIAARLLPQLEDDGVTVRARAEATKTLRLALTVPAHTAYEIPGLKK